MSQTGMQGGFIPGQEVSKKKKRQLICFFCKFSSFFSFFKETHEFKVKVKSVHKALKKFVDAKREVAAQLTALYESITALESDQGSEFYKYVNYIGKTFKAVSIHESQFCDALGSVCENALSAIIDFDVPDDVIVATATSVAPSSKAGKEMRVLRGFISTVTLMEDTIGKEAKVINVLNGKLKRAEQYIEEHETSKPTMEGVLGTRGGGKVYAVLQQDGVIHRYREGKEPEEDPLDVLMVTVKPFSDSDPENKVKFELHSPKLQKPLVLAASSVAEKGEWVRAIQAAIEARLSAMSVDPSSTSSSHVAAVPSLPAAAQSAGADSDAVGDGSGPFGGGNGDGAAGASAGGASDDSDQYERELDAEAIAAIRSTAGNNVCAECGAAEPEWASIKLGIVICLECSGIHRSLGTHISKVRSLTLDKWLPEYVLFLRSRGNTASNRFLEANVPPTVVRLNPRTPRPQREEFIRNKYVKHLYAAPIDPTAGVVSSSSSSSSSPEELGRALYAVATKTPVSIDLIIKLLVNGADPNYVCKGEAYKTPLFAAAATGNIMALEALLQYGASPTAQDIRGWTPIHYAAYFNHPRCLRRLLAQLKRGSVKDNVGLSPLDVASWNEAKECVHLLAGSSECDMDYSLTVDKVIRTDPALLPEDMFAIPKNIKIPPLYVCVTIPHLS